MVALAWAAPPAKLGGGGAALELELVPHAWRLVEAVSVNVTLAPATGLPSRPDLHRERLRLAAATLAICFGGTATSRAGIPAAVFVSANETEPYRELAVTV